MSRVATWLGLGVAWSVWLAGPLHGSPATPVAHWVDDRGRVIEEPLDLCFQVELRSDCRHIAARAEVRLPPDFYSLRIEGEDHGPLVLRRAELKPRADGSFEIAVARKARLQVESGTRQQPLTVSLYAPQDPTFREPMFRASLRPGETGVKIPAGNFVASLALARNAPDLHRVKAEPAARVRLTYRALQGWSLVARCRAAVSLRPVSGVEVKVAEAFGYGRKERPLAGSTSSPDGLVLLSGLQATMISLSARHPEFIPAEVQGLTASPGSFAFREVDLAIGGRLAAHVTLHGRPLAGVRCQVYTLASAAQYSKDSKDKYRELWAGPVDRLGVCRSERLAQGVYKLLVRIPETTSGVIRWVRVPEAQDADEDVALAPTRIAGEVRRGGRPIPEYSVQAKLLTLHPPKGAYTDTPAEAVSDAEGKYELTLWEPGRYGFFLRSPSGTMAPVSKDLTTEGDEDQKVDFDLAANSLQGLVTDEVGRPVAAVTVGLRWTGGVLLGSTDDGGKFAIDLQGEGSVTLTARKPGYREADPVSVQVAKDAPLPPVTLVLKRKATVSGTVLSAAGSPVAGASVASLGSTPETGPLAYRMARTDGTGSFEVETPSGPPRVFVSGPGCPLAGFDLQPPGSATGTDGSETLQTLRCAELPTALEMTLADDQGTPLPHAGVILRKDGAIIPQQVLAEHLLQLGISPETDGTGHIVLAGLAPGNYEIFLNTISSESTIAAGLRQGFLTSVTLPALATTELQLTIPRAQ